MNDLISREKAINTVINMFYKCESKDVDYKSALIEAFKVLPSAQPDPISEAYAKAVRTWLVNYQVKCADLQGRYTPYEVLGWIVSDWRKENGIW